MATTEVVLTAEEVHAACEYWATRVVLRHETAERSVFNMNVSDGSLQSCSVFLKTTSAAKGNLR